MPMLVIRVLCLLFFSSIACANEWKVQTLYHSLDQTSLSDLFAFYQLHSDSTYGQKALERAFLLINKHRNAPITENERLHFPPFDIQGIIAIVNRKPFDSAPKLTEQQIKQIERISDHLMHRTLKGHTITQIDDVASLQENEIDLARALLLYQFDHSAHKMHHIKEYEANLDLMALQILAKLPQKASNLEKIKAINHFIFHEMRFRFPPQSISNKEIDTFTFLPSVMDSRLGVCLGVSILYLTLAQRIGLDLEIITPPGHIYLSYVDVDGHRLNIETTARGIHIPEKHYFGMNTIQLKNRSIRETIGLNFFNQASVCWEREDHEQAVELYLIAEKYMPNDPLLNLFLGLNYLFIGEESKGKACLEFVKNHPNTDVLFQDTLSDDYLNHKVRKEGLKAIFKQVDETRHSIFEKQKKIEDELTLSPQFREGWFHLAITWLQLSRLKEAQVALEKYHALDSKNPTVEYYLSMVYLDRYQYSKAFEHLQNCYTLICNQEHQKQILRPLRMELNLINPQFAVSEEKDFGPRTGWPGSHP